MASKLEVCLFGTCAFRLTAHDGAVLDFRGAKHRAFFALLATAPMGRRSRAFLQTTLWGERDYDSGHQNLRRALSDLRKQMGSAFESILHVTSTDVQLALDQVQFRQGHGSFLEDLNIREPGFVQWRDDMRARPLELQAFGKSGGGKIRLQPRISALALNAPGGEPELRVLGDWVAEEMCRALSRSTLLTVISHLSSRAMSNQLIDIKSVRKALDVDYLLTGTIRKVSGKVSCDFDFVDTSNGAILWNRNLLCSEEALLGDLPDCMIGVLQAVGKSIAKVTLANVHGRTLPEVADHELLIAGVSAMHRPALRDFLNARLYLLEAAARAPAVADIHAWLGKWFVLNVFKGYSTDRTADAQRALDCTARALDLDPESSFALTIDGFIHGNLLRDMGEASRRYSTALDQNPNESFGWLLRGALLAFQDQGLAAVEATQTARRLSPIDPFGYYFDSLASTAHLAAGNYRSALEFADSSLLINDRHISTLRAKITAQHFLGDGDGARQTANILMRRFPEFKLEDYRRTHPSAGHKLGQQVIEALGTAGIS